MNIDEIFKKEQDGKQNNKNKRKYYRGGSAE